MVFDPGPMMLDELRRREAEGRPIHVGLVGLGSMGLAIAHQVGITPGMRLSFAADHDEAAVERVATLHGKSVSYTTDALSALRDQSVACDVLVEATNSIVPAFDYCMAAIERGAHCILMNAEVDLILGFLLRSVARQRSVVVTSDAGDQHGVLSRMIEEIQLWGFEVVQAGNMKGFLDRHRTLAGSREIAKSLRLSPEQCLAYTDGTKLNIEMSIIANQYALVPTRSGMEGPKADKVEDVMDLFDFDAYGRTGRVDYILGAKQHGGGVYVVGRCENELQAWYLNYYKVRHKHPYYLFFRPYHLCHIETTRAIAEAALHGKSLCDMKGGRMTDCYAHAKRPLSPGDPIERAIGSDEVYGLIDDAGRADARGQLPLGLLEAEEGAPKPTLRRHVLKDEPLAWQDVSLPDSRLLTLWSRQSAILGA